MAPAQEPEGRRFAGYIVLASRYVWSRPAAYVTWGCVGGHPALVHAPKIKVQLPLVVGRSFDPAFDVSRRAAAESGLDLLCRRLFCDFDPDPPTYPPTHHPPTDLH